MPEGEGDRVGRIVRIRCPQEGLGPVERFGGPKHGQKPLELSNVLLGS